MGAKPVGLEGLPSRGVFITFEGGEGAGKSTQISLLSLELHRLGIPHQITREPGGTPLAESLRSLLVQGAPESLDPITEILLMLAARRDHVTRRIRPALEAGEWILCDRFSDSTLAYQGYGHQLGEDFVRKLQSLVLGDFEPEITFLLTLSADVGLLRKARDLQGTGSEDRFERLETAFHHRVLEGYSALSQAEADRVVCLDGEKPSGVLVSQILGVLKERFLEGDR